MSTEITDLLPQRRQNLRARRSFASGRTILALMIREMSTTYGRTPGGYLWAVLEPIAGIAILSLVFSATFHAPALGKSFPLFYATGMIPFLVFSGLSGKIAQSLNFSKTLMSYPSVTFVDAILGRFFLNFLTDLMVAYLVFSGLLLLLSDTRAILNLPSIAEALFLAGYLGLGIGTFNCFMFTRFHVWQQVWSIVMRPMFIISCVFFLFESIPQPYQGYLWYNPLAHVVGLMRHGFYSNYDSSYVSKLYVIGVASLFLLLGLVFLRRHHRDLLTR